jgi:aminoglycoside phosphotransferase family enzyme
MHRFGESGRLDRVCVRGELEPKHVSALADAVIAFHRGAAIAPINTRFGSPDAVQAQALENFEELHSLLSDKECRIKLDTLLAWTRAEFNRLAPRFAARTWC